MLDNLDQIIGATGCPNGVQIIRAWQELYSPLLDQVFDVLNRYSTLKQTDDVLSRQGFGVNGGGAATGTTGAGLGL